MRIWTSASMWIFTVSFALQIVPAGGVKYTHRPMNGYYYASAYMTNYTAIGHQSCVAHCITNPHCWVLAYNSRAKYCLLGTLPCAEAVAGDDFRMMTFRKHENISCIQWVWSDGTSYPSSTVEQIHPLYQALARKPIQGEIYIGRSNPGSAFIKPDQRNPWIKDQLGNALLSTILHLQLPNFVSCGRDKPSHMTQNLVTVGVKLQAGEWFLFVPWSTDQADLVW